MRYSNQACLRLGINFVHASALYRLLWLDHPILVPKTMYRSRTRKEQIEIVINFENSKFTQLLLCLAFHETSKALVETFSGNILKLQNSAEWWNILRPYWTKQKRKWCAYIISIICLRKWHWAQIMRILEWKVSLPCDTDTTRFASHFGFSEILLKILLPEEHKLYTNLP